MEQRGMKGRGKREIPKKIRRPTASSGTILTCENPESEGYGRNISYVRVASWCNYDVFGDLEEQFDFRPRNLALTFGVSKRFVGLVHYRISETLQYHSRIFKDTQATNDPAVTLMFVFPFAEWPRETLETPLLKFCTGEKPMANAVIANNERNAKKTRKEKDPNTWPSKFTKYVENIHYLPKSNWTPVHNVWLLVVTPLESCRATSCGYNSSQPVWHALYECLQDIQGDSSPFLLQPFHELSNGFWRLLTSPHPSIQFVPKMFYRVEVGALAGHPHAAAPAPTEGVAHSHLQPPPAVALAIHNAVKNDTVNEINNLIIQRVPGQVKTYKSIDTVTNVDDVVHFPQDFLNSLNPSGLPPHELSLKVDLKENLIVATILTGPAAGQLANIPRIPMIPTDLPISFKRGVTPGFSYVKIMPNDVGDEGVFSGLPFLPPLHSGAATYSPRFTRVDSQDPDVKNRPTAFLCEMRQCCGSTFNSRTTLFLSQRTVFNSRLLSIPGFKCGKHCCRWSTGFLRLWLQGKECRLPVMFSAHPSAFNGVMFTRHPSYPVPPFFREQDFVDPLMSAVPSMGLEPKTGRILNPPCSTPHFLSPPLASRTPDFLEKLQSPANVAWLLYPPKGYPQKQRLKPTHLRRSGRTRKLTTTHLAEEERGCLQVREGRYYVRCEEVKVRQEESDTGLRKCEGCVAHIHSRSPEKSNRRGLSAESEGDERHAKLHLDDFISAWVLR
ncbi:hypothetical protein PR048_008271 [Dryococelus australis]|uniref:ATP-dependent DNA helicase n=1 Tax=Dryococelus australis TaxID=614101 RepID=A0ABQ9HWM8_9NEOP|nr:hypothetical protein PR048_008271 [Dryococelus australis]